MEKQHVVALLQYLQRASSTVPTTGAEWEAVRAALMVLEGVATGRSRVEVKPVEGASPP